MQRGAAQHTYVYIHPYIHLEESKLNSADPRVDLECFLPRPLIYQHYIYSLGTVVYPPAIDVHGLFADTNSISIPCVSDDGHVHVLVRCCWLVRKLSWWGGVRCRGWISGRDVENGLVGMLLINGVIVIEQVFMHVVLVRASWRVINWRLSSVSGPWLQQ